MVPGSLRTTPTGGMSVRTVLNKLAEPVEPVEPVEHVGEFGEQNWGDMDEDETADWRKVLTGLEAAATTFRHTVNASAKWSVRATPI
ncbi:hypothetical protein [Nonomuraea sp. B1E8]|uniref:hypothetical protein n=1 Tax=unclassified Nonomuraea TaxID=2593643 RepID=UPI00325C85E5